MLSIVSKDLFMNNNQKKQTSTILTALGSIIVSAFITALFQEEIRIGPLSIFSIFMLSIAFYWSAVVVLKKESGNDRKHSTRID